MAAADPIAAEELTKIFGPAPERALAQLQQGASAEQLRATGHTAAVWRASFSVREGEVFVIMGLSGSGKSTLLRLVNRLIEPTAGKVWLRGQQITAMPRRDLVAIRRRQVSMVFQSFALLPHRTVLDNAAFGLEVAGVSRSERRDRARRAVRDVGLGEHEDQYPSELSGGMKQRVGLARALAVDPSVLLMDEAFSALDPLIRTEMQDQLLAIQRESPRTVLFISHDIDEATRIGDRIAIMDRGVILQVDAPDGLIAHPASELVRSFFHKGAA